MGSFVSAAAAASPEFVRAFRLHADPAGHMTFARFMELALYDPAIGYYRREQRRIGYELGTDFFTASTSGPIFGELVVAACVHLLGDADPDDFTFVEIGTEAESAEAKAGGGVLAGVDHPFAAARTVGVGQRLDLAGQCIVFANELLDAQPFHRFVFRGGAWRELGVALHDNALVVIELPIATPAPLPAGGSEGYVIDAPLAARNLVERIAALAWSGLFVTADYGKSWRELIEATPEGTARAYFRHTQSNDLLARPGEQDLTCHICWDWIGAALEQHGFPSPTLESQEAFFIRHAARVIAATSEAEAGRFSRKKLALAQLLHPTHLGQKFQVLHARR